MTDAIAAADAVTAAAVTGAPLPFTPTDVKTNQ